jgi:glycosyltransferase involved in cell wall biosynthesis
MLTDKPLVSVIALCYNQQDYLKYTLDSIIKQDYPNVELIIIDDCSGDGSVVSIEEWVRDNGLAVTLVKNERNLGICKAANIGLKHCHGKYFQLIACDDVLLPQKISKQVAILEEDDKLAFAFSDAYLMNDQHEWQQHGPKFIQTNLFHFTPFPKNLYQLLISEKNFIPAPSVLVRTAYLTSMGGYDESLSFEDYDVWLRLSKKYNAVYNEEPLCLYRVHMKNMTHQLQIQSQHIVTKFMILYKHVGVSKEMDEMLDLKLYALLKQLFYTGASEIKAIASMYYTRFNQDRLLKFAVKFPFAKIRIYNMLLKLKDIV